jgi:hypothetical protein
MIGFTRSVIAPSERSFILQLRRAVGCCTIMSCTPQCQPQAPSCEIQHSLEVKPSEAVADRSIDRSIETTAPREAVASNELKCSATLEYQSPKKIALRC